MIQQFRSPAFPDFVCRGFWIVPRTSSCWHLHIPGLDRGVVFFCAYLFSWSGNFGHKVCSWSYILICILSICRHKFFVVWRLTCLLNRDKYVRDCHDMQISTSAFEWWSKVSETFVHKRNTKSKHLVSVSVTLTYWIEYVPYTSLECRSIY